ncbi:RNA polymerase sigma factor [Sphaerisporangium siamense]|uniref:RNA polymerase sigma factor n=1 Tax=Sphaerisporangium siamense TaxID=795645 RepID=A0A7W7D193_9ACTN|nr:RNA polymerase sigma factor [Sphaerisporangium siamense]MBB4698475.1 RNA polymerase sigma-70 factor (ECF subfamily) [Sphaerisporangium siamense]GII85464.1 RNA polymerase sigma factor [Sphaerisporangium siamense]
MAGDLAAYEVLVTRYSAVAHRTAALLGAGDEAEDVVQEAFVRAFRYLSGFRRDAAFKPWLLRIVANLTHDLTRSRGRRNDLVLKIGVEPETRVPDDPEGVAIAGDRRARLLEAVRALPERERQAVVCRYFLQLSEAETAEVLGWPLGSVKSRTFRGLARLRKEVGHELS